MSRLSAIRIFRKFFTLALIFGALFSFAVFAAGEAGWENPLRVHFIDVGQGDCSLVQCPNGTAILVDGGRIWTYPFLIDYLKNAGVEKIDLLVLSHPHGDHFGGLIKVLKEFPVAVILDSGKDDTGEHYQRFLETVKSRTEVDFKLARAGDRFTFGEVKMLVIHPSSRLPATVNNSSIIFKLTYGDSDFLFTGDAEMEAEAEAMSRGFNLRSEVLKVGHHGSRTSTGPAFLSRASPRWAVIPAGENNSYGHPHPEVTRRLKMRGTKIYQTGTEGTVLFLSNGKDLRVELPGRAVYPEYAIPEEQASRIIANRETLIYYDPHSPYVVQIPPEDRVVFDTAVAAETAGYRRNWW
ncbi:MAG: ComEC/Rec2 family competence protein [Candidatus Erginobacter occultus]|nr:ComEC/Rec2 family competence protein [Candidatus Erginobacter occultus]